MLIRDISIWLDGSTVSAARFELSGNFVALLLDHFAVRADKRGALGHILLLIIRLKPPWSELTRGLEYGA